MEVEKEKILSSQLYSTRAPQSMKALGVLTRKRKKNFFALLNKWPRVPNLATRKGWRQKRGAKSRSRYVTDSRVNPTWMYRKWNVWLGPEISWKTAAHISLLATGAMPRVQRLRIALKNILLKRGSVLLRANRKCLRIRGSARNWEARRQARERQADNVQGNDGSQWDSKTTCDRGANRPP